MTGTYTLLSHLDVGIIAMLVAIAGAYLSWLYD